MTAEQEELKRRIMANTNHFRLKLGTKLNCIQVTEVFVELLRLQQENERSCPECHPQTIALSE